MTQLWDLTVSMDAAIHLSVVGRKTEELKKNSKAKSNARDSVVQASRVAVAAGGPPRKKDAIVPAQHEQDFKS